MRGIPAEVLGFYQLMQALVRTKGNKDAARKFARKSEFDARVVDVLDELFTVKAAVAAARMGDATWAGPLASLRTLSQGFIASLRSISLLDALSQDLVPIPRGVHFAVTSVAAVATSNVAEASMKPITKLDFTGDILDSAKALAMVIVTLDMLKFAPEQTQDLLFREMQGAVGFASDGPVIAKLLQGITTIASTGDARADIRKALAEVAIKQTSKPVIVTSCDVVKQLALLGVTDGAPAFPDVAVPSGGSIAGMPLLGIDSLSNYSTLGDLLIVVDASQCAGNVGLIELGVATDAMIAMSDSPADGPQNMVSLFQTDSVALRAERYFAFDRLREEAVGVIKGVVYAPGSGL